MQTPNICLKNLKLPLVILCGLLSLTPHSAMAGKDDFKQPVLVDSDRQNIDLKTNTTVFDKNVSVSQGSLSIRADRLLATRQDKKGKEVYIATGHPARYQQTLDNGKPILAEANEITYDVDAKMLVLKGNAMLTQNNSQVAGETIRFDLINQTLEAERSDKEQVKSIFSTNDGEEQNNPQEDP